MYLLIMQIAIITFTGSSAACVRNANRNNITMITTVFFFSFFLLISRRTGMFYFLIILGHNLYIDCGYLCLGTYVLI